MPEKPIAYNAYQTLADAYAAKIDVKPHNAYYERPAMLSLLPDVDGKRVLDAGCGPGAYSEALVNRGAIVNAFDVSDRMLELASERLRDSIEANKVKLHLLDMTQPLTAFADNEFDMVNAPLCLDYIENWLSLFNEFHRVLKTNGTFLFSCGHPASDAEYFSTKKYFSVEPVSATWSGFGIKVRMPCFRRSMEEIFTPVIEAGFVIEKVHEPLPTAEFKKADPRRYRALMQRPVFLCVRSRKLG